MMRTEAHRLGAFSVKSGTLIVSDPCYDVGTWCQGKIENVKCGTWTAEVITTNDTDGWGQRCTELLIQHSKHVPFPEWQKTDIHVGVDSGQAGFWDLPAFKGGEGECDEPGTFYGDACAATLDNKIGAAVVSGGVVSRSGYGDGSYSCFVQRNASGEAVAARVVFITDEPEDEEDDS